MLQFRLLSKIFLILERDLQILAATLLKTRLFILGTGLFVINVSHWQISDGNSLAFVIMGNYLY